MSQQPIRKCMVCGTWFHPQTYREFCSEHCHALYMQYVMDRERRAREEAARNSFKARWERIGRSNVAATGRFSKKFKLMKFRGMEV